MFDGDRVSFAMSTDAPDAAPRPTANSTAPPSAAEAETDLELHRAACAARPFGRHHRAERPYVRGERRRGAPVPDQSQPRRLNQRYGATADSTMSPSAKG